MKANTISVSRYVPDWNNCIDTDEFQLLPCYEDPVLYFLLPRTVQLAKQADQSPEFSLEFVSDRNGSGTADSLYSNVYMRLTKEVDTPKAYDFLKKQQPDSIMMPATLCIQTWWYFQLERTIESHPFAWSDADNAQIQARISSKSGDLIYGALAHSNITVARAAIEAGIASFLPRIESTASFKTADLLSSLHALGDNSISFNEIVYFFAHPPTDLIYFSGTDTGGPGRSRALALAGRVEHFFGQRVRAPRISDGPYITLLKPSDPMLKINTTWDLRTPLRTAVPLLLDFDPFTPIVKQGGRDRITSFTKVPPLPDQLLTERVIIDANLPPNIITHSNIELTLKVARNLSRSGRISSKVVELIPRPDEQIKIDLEFNRNKPKPYSAKVSAISPNGILVSDWFECNGDYLNIEAGNLPGLCSTLRATQKLLDQAIISVATSGEPKTNTLVAKLSEQEPSVTFLTKSVSQTARFVVTAQDRRDAAKSLELNLPYRSVLLDLYAFSQYGPKTVIVTVNFESVRQSAEFEFLPECSNGPPITLSFSPTANSDQWSYVVTNVFEHRFRFRRSTFSDVSEPSWSEYQSPDVPLTIDVETGEAL